MALHQRLSEEIKAAMLARDADRLSTLRLLKSAVGYAQIERKTENLSDADFVAVAQKEIKKRRDSIEQYEKGGRPELAEKEKKEMARKKANGFYEYVKMHVRPKGEGVKLTIYLPQGASSNLFSEIKSSVRKKRARKQAGPKLVVNKPAA